MIAKQIVEDIYLIPLRIVNAYLVVGENLTLIDTGMPGSAGKILQVIKELGYQPQDVQHILVTHLHADHVGGLAELKAATGAPAAMHPLDADLTRRGEVMRPSKPAPGLFNQFLTRVVMPLAPSGTVDPVEIELELAEGQELEYAAGLSAIHSPGHSAGHLSLYRPNDGGLLIVGDAASNMMGLGYPPIYEDLDEGLRSLSKLAALDFEIACFGHGNPITGGAAGRFRGKWGAG